MEKRRRITYKTQTKKTKTTYNIAHHLRGKDRVRHVRSSIRIKQKHVIQISTLTAMERKDKTEFCSERNYY